MEIEKKIIRMTVNGKNKDERSNSVPNYNRKMTKTM